MRRSLTLAALIATMLPLLHGQERCTARTITQRWLEEHGLSTDIAAAARSVPAAQARGGTATIPVVVHVVWNIPAENVADALILQLIATLNEDFNALNSDYGNVRAAFLNDRGNPQLEFCLAQTDPQGNPTTGITRTQTGETWFDPENETDDMKQAPDGIAPWSPANYLNIWICDITSGASGGLITDGYAYLPYGGTAGTAIDGLVVDYDYGLDAGARVATHEIGHYLGLDHPWADGGCSSDDGIDDTPVTDQPTYSCANPGLMRCNTLTQYENFMDYANCVVMFTTDQSAQMNNVLSSLRPGLLTNNACGTVIPGPCVPTSSNGTGLGDFIDGVQLGSISNLNSGGTSGATYNNYTAQFITQLQRGGSDTLTITSGTFAPDHFAAWIDMDRDGLFEASEKLGEFTNTAPGDAQDIVFTIPLDAASDTTILRVRGVYIDQGEADPVDPCFNYSRGETEDYGITIVDDGNDPCIPTSAIGTAEGDFIDGVQLEGISNTGSGSTGGPVYHDYTAQNTGLARGQSYTLTLTSGAYEQDMMAAWIDLDANGTFDAAELLGGAETSTAFEDVQLAFTVPADATLGTTILRARCMYPEQGEPTSADPCFNFSYGETEDYGVTILTSTGVAVPVVQAPMVWPNPAGDLLNVRLPDGSATLEVTDASGRTVLPARWSTGTSSISTTPLANGPYVLRCTTKGTTHMVRFIVRHTH